VVVLQLNFQIRPRASNLSTPATLLSLNLIDFSKYINLGGTGSAFVHTFRCSDSIAIVRYLTKPISKTKLHTKTLTICTCFIKSFHMTEVAPSFAAAGSNIVHSVSIQPGVDHLYRRDYAVQAYHSSTVATTHHPMPHWRRQFVQDGPQAIPRLSPSRSKKEFLEHMGISEENERDKRLYRDMMVGQTLSTLSFEHCPEFPLWLTLHRE
jgi:hypothetical protein